MKILGIEIKVDWATGVLNKPTIDTGVNNDVLISDGAGNVKDSGIQIGLMLME